ncbi:MAG: hypothetical protein DI551_08570 [Micavibrio aeruginosavorus]|uniref:Periplasmic chaperone PpiD n=1 Tax=Micavibrio aeruginosavorus TaxID=349221 RepID=A0A2W5Q152_9BACT|nr:MAG: hypothetical protein DI551_08570 [Micavibrio aeruginosavorus]
MSMLIWMRSGAGAGIVKFTLMGLLLLAVGGLVLMDVGGFFKTQMGSNTIVKGGGIEIGAVEFDRTVRRVIGRQGIGPQEAWQLGMINNILTGEIQDRLFTQRAKKLGLEVSDDDVTRQIAKLAEPLATEGRSKKEALQQILRTQGISESEFVGSIRQEMGNTLLRAALAPPATLTSPLLAADLYRYDNESRDVKIVVLKNSGVSGLAAPTDEQLQKYYDANKVDFLIPETRTVTMATLKGDMLKKNIKISDEQLKAEYEKNIASFTKPQRRVVEQAVLKTEAEAKIAVDAVKAGKTLKDSVPVDSYNGEQDFEQAGLLPEIATPVFESKEGAVLGPIKTDLGWHAIIVKNTLPEEVTPFEKMKDSLRTELENIALTDELFQAGNTIEDRIAAGDKFEDIVSEYGMTTEIIGPFRQNGIDRDGKDLFKSYASDKDQIVQAAYDYEEGEITPTIETADGQFRFLRIDQVIPDSYRPYESVKAELETRWMNEQRKLANKARAKEALAALDTGKSLEDIAAQYGGAVQSIANVNRKQTAKAPLTPVSAAQIFSAAKGGSFSAETSDGVLVGRVENITLPSTTTDKENLAQLIDLTGRSLAQDILAQFTTSLSEGSQIKINQQRLQEIYGKPQDQAQ